MRNYCFELDIIRNVKKEFIDQVIKTKEQQEEIDFKNQVYERVFSNIGIDMKKDESDEESDDSTIRKKLDIRDDWIKQQRYMKFES